MFQSALPQVRTRAFARVLGPFLTIVTALIIYRLPTMAETFADFFTNEAMVWITGAMLLLSGLIIIAFHQYWRTLAAVLVSLFGWFLALRGAVLLIAPNLIIRGGEAMMPHQTLLRLGFGLLTLIGLYLTYVGWIADPSED
ncbi:MAG TPA: hypothetical protein VGU72_14780 [Beijerinckiaceae bacterium]|nr:hypothetical protein [Beijerinckiaceae bacterium]